jgi:hypothetical protein
MVIQLCYTTLRDTTGSKDVQEKRVSIGAQLDRRSSLAMMTCPLILRATLIGAELRPALQPSAPFPLDRNVFNPDVFSLVEASDRVLSRL